MVKVPQFQIRFWRGETTVDVGSSASLSGLAPPWRHALVSGSHLDPKMTGNSGSGAVRAGRNNLRSHFVFRPRHAPE